MFSAEQGGLMGLVLVIVAAPLVAALGTLLLRQQRRVLGWLTLFFALLSLSASLLLAALFPRETPLRFWYFYLDSLSVYFLLLVNLVACAASWYALDFLAVDAVYNPHHHPSYFHFFFNLFHFTMLVVPVVDNLVVLWIAVELTTVFSTMLVRYRRTRAALEAAWKFIMITTTGIIFALLGTLFLAGSMTEETQALLGTLQPGGDYLRWSLLAYPPVAETLNPDLVMISFLFVLLGYGTKAGLAPMHTWLPDGHGEAPSPVSALLSGVMLKSALFAILRFYTITNLQLGAENPHFSTTLLLVAGLLSLILATPFILKRNSFKRVLAYHSLEHMGIITFGIGIGTPIALFGALLHALNHAVTKALMFLLFGHIQGEYRRHTTGELQEGQAGSLQGVLRSMPFSGTLLAGGGLALVGSPPFSIFMSEFIILWAALAAIRSGTGLPAWLLGVAVVLFLITITLIFGGLVRHLARLLLDRPPFDPLETGVRDLPRLAPFLLLFAIILLFGILVPAWPVNFPVLLNQSTTLLIQGAPHP